MKRAIYTEFNSDQQRYEVLIVDFEKETATGLPFKYTPEVMAAVKTLQDNLIQ